MSRWPRDLVAAASVEAACGIVAAAWTNACGNGHQPIAVFAACTLAAVAADMVLVPGCVWSQDDMLFRVTSRVTTAGLTLVAAVISAFLSVMPLLVLGLAMPTAVKDAAGEDAGRIVVLLIPFLVAGGITGLGAALADAGDARPGIVRARTRSHLAGGVVGVVLVLELALGSARADAVQAGSRWEPLLGLAPLALVFGGSVRHALMARDAVRTGTALADGDAVWPAALCCAALLALAAAARLMPTLAVN